MTVYLLTPTLASQPHLRSPIPAGAPRSTLALGPRMAGRLPFAPVTLPGPGVRVFVLFHIHSLLTLTYWVSGPGLGTSNGERDRQVGP